MKRPTLRNLSTSTLLVSLAIFDLLKLVTGILMVGEDSSLRVVYPQVKTFFQTTFTCASFYFFQKFVTTTAIWLVTTITVERFIIVFFPQKAERLTTQRNAKILVGCVAAVNLMFNLDYLFTTKFDEKKQDCSSRTFYEDACEYRTKYKGIAEAVWKLLPLVINTILNGCIIAKSCRSPKIVPSPTNKNSTTSQNELLWMLVTVSIVSTVVLIPPNIRSGISKFTSYDDTCKKVKDSIDINGTLSSSSLHPSPPPPPSSSSSSTSSSVSSFPAPPPSSGKKKETIETSTDCFLSVLNTYIAGRPFFLLNHAINFFLYVLTCKKFRYEFFEMNCQWILCCCCLSCGERGNDDDNLDHDDNEAADVDDKKEKDAFLKDVEE